jgi:hypothetical protein
VSFQVPVRLNLGDLKKHRAEAAAVAIHTSRKCNRTLRRRCIASKAFKKAGWFHRPAFINCTAAKL